MLSLAAIGRVLKSIGGTAWAIMGAVAAVLAVYLKARGDGRAAQRNDQLEHDAGVKDDQLEALANRPRSDAELDERLRRGDF